MQISTWARRDDGTPAQVGDIVRVEHGKVHFDVPAMYDPGPAVGPLVAPVGQSRSKSLIETVTSTAIGFSVSLVLTAAVMPAFGYPTTWTHDFWITVIFTVASVLRGYLVRRAFNR